MLFLHTGTKSQLLVTYAHIVLVIYRADKTSRNSNRQKEEQQ